MDSPANSLPRRRALAALHGACLAAWWSLWAYATVFAAENAWWQLRLDPGQVKLFSALERLLLEAFGHLGLGWLDSLAAASLLLVVLGALAGLAVALTGQLLRCDRERLAWTAIVDTARHPRQWLSWVGLPIAVFIVLVLWPDRPGPAFGAVASFALLWTVAAPFFVLDRRKLDRVPSRAPLAPRWPGALPLLWALAAWLAGIAVQIGLGHLTDASPVFAWPLTVLSWIVGLVAGIYFLAAWLDGIDAIRAPHRTMLSARALLAFAVLWLRAMILGLWLAAPLLALLVSHVYVWPQVEAIAPLQGAFLVLVHATRLVEAYWWLFALPFLVPLNLAVSGRLYVALFPGAIARLNPFR